MTAAASLWPAPAKLLLALPLMRFLLFVLSSSHLTQLHDNNSIHILHHTIIYHPTTTSFVQHRISTLTFIFIVAIFALQQLPWSPNHSHLLLQL